MQPIEMPGDRIAGSRVLGEGRRATYARVVRGLDVVAATNLFLSMRQEPGWRKNVREASGPGAGQVWATLPSEPLVDLTSAQWRVATGKRLHILRKPKGATV